MTVLLAQASAEWEKTDPQRRPRGSKILKRDGWRCRAPGCKSRRNLEVHHIRYRSRGGSDAAENRITLCAVHHRRIVHEGYARVTGQAPHALSWVLGIGKVRAPLMRLEGERIVT